MRGFGAISMATTALPASWQGCALNIGRQILKGTGSHTQQDLLAFGNKWLAEKRGQSDYSRSRYREQMRDEAVAYVNHGCYGRLNRQYAFNMAAHSIFRGECVASPHPPSLQSAHQEVAAIANSLPIKCGGAERGGRGKRFAAQSPASASPARAPAQWGRSAQSSRQVPLKQWGRSATRGFDGSLSEPVDPLYCLVALAVGVGVGVGINKAGWV